MTGHAFQTILGRDHTERFLDSVARCLHVGGLFAFESRNPAARAWEGWAERPPVSIIMPDGKVVSVTTRLTSDFKARQSASFTPSRATLPARHSRAKAPCSSAASQSYVSCLNSPALSSKRNSVISRVRISHPQAPRSLWLRAGAEPESGVLIPLRAASSRPATPSQDRYPRLSIHGRYRSRGR
jgi:hypothetical protein